MLGHNFIYIRHVLNEGLNEDVICSFCKALESQGRLELDIAGNGGCGLNKHPSITGSKPRTYLVWGLGCLCEVGKGCCGGGTPNCGRSVRAAWQGPCLVRRQSQVSQGLWTPAPEEGGGGGRHSHTPYSAQMSALKYVSTRQGSPWCPLLFLHHPPSQPG